jgi:hypothetical protein
MMRNPIAPLPKNGSRYSQGCASDHKPKTISSGIAFRIGRYSFALLPGYRINPNLFPTFGLLLNKHCEIRHRREMDVLYFVVEPVASLAFAELAKLDNRFLRAPPAKVALSVWLSPSAKNETLANMRHNSFGLADSANQARAIRFRAGLNLVGDSAYHRIFSAVAVVQSLIYNGCPNTPAL